MTIAIIGAGSVGSAPARAFARAGEPAILSNSRSPASLADLVAKIGGSVRAGSREEAAAQEIVIVAVNWSKLPVALNGLPDFVGRIVIDANNPIEPPTFKPAELHGRLSTEVFSDFVRGARVVKAFNHLSAEILAQDPRTAGGRRVLFFSGSDALAKTSVRDLINKLGFVGVDLGPVDEGGRAIKIPDGGLTSLNLIQVK
jgi:predicted dinucleotide-binding enzyme